MKIKWDYWYGWILGLIIAVLLVKLFIAPEAGLWEIVVKMVRGTIGI